jgi:hypothetical protein
MQALEFCFAQQHGFNFIPDQSRVVVQFDFNAASM